MITPPETEEKILKLALKHPFYGCNRYETLLKAKGISVSTIAIQKILNKHKLGTRYDSWLALEKQVAELKIELSAERIAFLGKQNPCFRERHVESSRPGKLFNQDTFYVGFLKDVGKETFELMPL